MGQQKLKTTSLFLFLILCGISHFFMIRLSYLGGDVIEKINDGTIFQDLLPFLGFIFLQIVLAMFFLSLKNIYRYDLLQGQMAFYRENLLSRILRQPIETIADRGPSYYQNLIYTDGESLRTNYFETTLSLFDQALLLLMASISITSIHPLLLGIAFLAALIPYFVPKLFEKKLNEKQENQSKSSEIFISSVKEKVYGLETIRDFNMEKKIFEDFRRDENFLLKETNRLYDSYALLGAVSFFSGFFMYAFVLSWGVYFYYHDLISMGAIMVATQLTNQIKSPLVQIIQLKTTRAGTLTLREKTSKDQFKEEEEKGTKIFFQRKIQIKNVSFSYGDRKILKNINGRILKNKKYLILGSSGSGKSTFFKLLLQWTREYEGEIFVDNTPLKNVAQKEWRKICLPLLQESHYFEKSIYFNIALTDDFDEEKMKKVIEEADLKNFIDRLDQEGHSILKEEGTNVSGGEKKRIALARVLYHEPEILLLDEAFSSLDKKTSREIEKRLLNLKNMTIINICHDVNEDLLKEYDGVFEFKNGSMNEISPLEIGKEKRDENH
ncbi:MAG: ABC transporter ATP-binding protein [Tissierellia bacterium]|nr:ABC transporter ATP-binding protein [Tissierellia bacterium]